MERKAVIVTCGEEGCWYLGESLDCPVHQPAFNVEVLDTTGCGDVFHGAYASGLIQDLDLPGRVRLRLSGRCPEGHTGGRSTRDSWSIQR